MNQLVVQSLKSLLESYSKVPKLQAVTGRPRKRIVVDFQDDGCIILISHSLSYTKELVRELWIAFHGDIPKGFVVHHQCEVRRCFNIHHLELLKHSDHNFYHTRKRWECGDF